jgi:hypothetical protein
MDAEYPSRFLFYDECQQFARREERRVNRATLMAPDLTHPDYPMLDFQRFFRFRLVSLMIRHL